MINISFFDRIKTIFDLIFSESFFVTLFVILILTVTVLIINMRVKSKAPKYAIAIVYSGLAILVLARYGHYVVSLNDSIVDKFFRAMYFPNIVVYLSMLIITVLLLALNIINNKYLKFTKVSSFLCFFFIWFLFVLTIDTVKAEGLNFYEISELYANGTVMILLQASMATFGVWCMIMIIDIIVRKLSDRMDKKDKMTTNNKQETVDDSKTFSI